MNRPVPYNDREEEFLDSPADGGSSFTEQLDIAHYLRILRKHKWPIVLFTALVTALAAYHAFTATPIYRATSTLLIEPQRANVVSIEELVGVDTENQDYYQTQFELLRSRGLAIRVMDKLSLWDHPELAPAAAPVARGPEGEAAPTSDGAFSSVRGMLAELGIGSDPGSDSIPGRDPGPADTLDAPSGDDRLELPADGSMSDGPMEFGTDPDTFGTSAASGTPSSASGGLSAEERAREVVLGRFMSRLGITPVRNTKLVRLSFESASPAFAAQVANTVGEEYITSYLDAKMELTTKASEWLQGRLGTLKETLDASEQRLIEFQRENGLIDVGGSVGRLNEQELLLATAELAQARSELAGAADLYRDTQALRGEIDLLSTIPAVQADALVQRAKIDLGQAQRELDELSNRYGERHPRVVDVQSRIASLNTALEGHVERVVGTIAKDYQLLQQRVSSIESKLDTGKEEIQAIGTKKFELDALQREVSTNREVYDTFFNRMTEARSADGLETANARISDYAVPPVNPVKPKKQLIIALAALGALALSMLMAFLYEQMDDTIKGTQDIERKLGLTLLGILPLVKRGLFSRGASRLPLNPIEIADKNGRFAESVKTVRTALCLPEGDKPRKVLVVTSSVPGEGKSTTAINLAYSLAQLERVLLIDCDLRRPSIAKAIDLDRDAAGLSNLILQTSSARDCIRRGMFGGAMDVLPSGPGTDQPLELLSSARFERILAQLSPHYDRVVIDSAPTQAVSDALILSRLSDAVIYAIRSHDTSLELAKRGIERLQQVSAPIVGAVVTQVDIDRINSYGGDYYYQGYYDYYGYNESGEKLHRRHATLSQDELMRIRNDEGAVDLDLDFAFADSWGGDNGSARRDVDTGPNRGQRDRVRDDLDII